MRKVFWLCAALVTILLGVAASFGAASTHHSVTLQGRAMADVPPPAGTHDATGRLVGAIVFVGNVPRSARKNRYHQGWVEIGRHGHLVAKQWVKLGHHYHFTLAPGSYDVAAYTRWGPPCRDTAQIAAGQTTNQDAYCSWH